MNSVVVRVVPLIPLPANHSTFDYAWTDNRAAEIGMLARITFRKKKCFGVVVGCAHSRATPYPLLAASPVGTRVLLNFATCAFAQRAARALNTSLSETVRRIIPPCGSRTAYELATPLTTTQVPHASDRSLIWYSSPHEKMERIKKILNDTEPPHALIAPTHAMVAEIMSALPDKHFTPYTPTSAPLRRTAWNQWMQRTGGAIIGTHLCAWLPAADGNTLTLIDPTHPAHEQWDGPPYHNVHVLELRHVYAAERHHYIAHTPSSFHFDQYANAPTLTAWPSLVDISDVPYGRRIAEVARVVATHAQQHQSISVLVSHLHRALNYQCSDCGTVSPASRTSSALPMCTQCHGTHIFALSCGGAALAEELITTHHIAAHDIALADIRHLAQRRITIITAAASDYINMEQYGCIIDAAADAAIRDARYDAEERVIGRLRRIAVSLAPSRRTVWCAVTTHPERPLWRTRDAIGLTAWWHTEQELRQKFKQPPFQPQVETPHET